MPVKLGTLDAIHLATIRLWKDMTHVDLVMATHDGALTLGARVWSYGGKGRRRVSTLKRHTTSDVKNGIYLRQAAVR